MYGKASLEIKILQKGVVSEQDCVMNMTVMHPGHKVGCTPTLGEGWW